MSSYQENLNRLTKIFDEVKNEIEAFPHEKRTIVLFGQWSLKDIVAHFSHWVLHDLDCIENLKAGTEPYWEPDVDAFNKKGVAARTKLSWEEVYNEFLKLRSRLIDEYTHLPQDLWTKKIWENRDLTPESFLEVDIDHYQNQHLPEIKRVLRSF